MDEKQQIKILEAIKEINEIKGPQYNQIFFDIKKQFTDRIDHGQMVKLYGQKMNLYE